MDSEDSCEILLPSDEELKKEQAQHEKSKDKEKKKKKKKKSRSSPSRNADTDKDGESTSVSRMRRRSNSLYLEVTPAEVKYRKKHFSDDKLLERKINCTTCSKNLKSLVVEGRDVFSHPVLRVLLCKDCCNFYGDGEFSLDEDGSDKYCRWCGQGGVLYCCSSCSCAFCRPCMKRNLNRSVLDDVKSEEWKCFVCKPKPLWDLRAVCAAAQEYGNKTKRERNSLNKTKLQELCSRKKSLTNESSRTSRLKNRNEDDHKQHEVSRKKTKSSSLDGDLDGMNISNNSVKRSGKTETNVASDSSSEVSSKKKRKKNVKQSDSSSSESEYMSKRKGKKYNKKRDSSVSEREKGKKRKGSRDSVEKVQGSKMTLLRVDRKNAKKACLWLQESCNDISKVADLTSAQANDLYTKGVNVLNMTKVKNVAKTVESIQRLVKLSVKNLLLASESVKLTYNRWLKKQRQTQISENKERTMVQNHDLKNDRQSVKEETVDDAPVTSRIKIKSVSAINKDWASNSGDSSKTKSVNGVVGGSYIDPVEISSDDDNCGKTGLANGECDQVEVIEVIKSVQDLGQPGKKLVSGALCEKNDANEILCESSERAKIEKEKDRGSVGEDLGNETLGDKDNNDGNKTECRAGSELKNDVLCNKSDNDAEVIQTKSKGEIVEVMRSNNGDKNKDSMGTELKNDTLCVENANGENVKQTENKGKHDEKMKDQSLSERSNSPKDVRQTMNKGKGGKNMEKEALSSSDEDVSQARGKDKGGRNVEDEVLPAGDDVGQTKSKSKGNNLENETLLESDEDVSQSKSKSKEGKDVVDEAILISEEVGRKTKLRDVRGNEDGASEEVGQTKNKGKEGMNVEDETLLESDEEVRQSKGEDKRRKDESLSANGEGMRQVKSKGKREKSKEDEEALSGSDDGVGQTKSKGKEGKSGEDGTSASDEDVRRPQKTGKEGKSEGRTSPTRSKDKGGKNVENAALPASDEDVGQAKGKGKRGKNADDEALSVRDEAVGQAKIGAKNVEDGALSESDKDLGQTKRKGKRRKNEENETLSERDGDVQQSKSKRKGGKSEEDKELSESVEDVRQSKNKRKEKKNIEYGTLSTSDDDVRQTENCDNKSQIKDDDKLTNEELNNTNNEQINEESALKSMTATESHDKVADHTSEDEVKSGDGCGDAVSALLDSQKCSDSDSDIFAEDGKIDEDLAGKSDSDNDQAKEENKETCEHSSKEEEEPDFDKLLNQKDKSKVKSKEEPLKIAEKSDRQLRTKSQQYTEDALKAQAALLEGSSDESEKDSDGSVKPQRKRKRRTAGRKIKKKKESKKHFRSGKKRSDRTKDEDVSSLDSNISDTADSESCNASSEEKEPKSKKKCLMNSDEELLANCSVEVKKKSSIVEDSSNEDVKSLQSLQEDVSSEKIPKDDKSKKSAKENDDSENVAKEDSSCKKSLKKIRDPEDLTKEEDISKEALDGNVDSDNVPEEDSSSKKSLEEGGDSEKTSEKGGDSEKLTEEDSASKKNLEEGSGSEKIPVEDSASKKIPDDSHSRKKSQKNSASKETSKDNSEMNSEDNILKSTLKTEKEDSEDCRSPENIQDHEGDAMEVEDEKTETEKSELMKIKSLVNLKTLKRSQKKKMVETSDDESSGKDVAKKRSASKKMDTKKSKKDTETTLKDFHDQSGSDESMLLSPSADNDKIDDLELSFKELHDKLEKKRNEMAKTLLLHSTSNDSDSESEKDCKKQKKKKTKTKIKDEVLSDVDVKDIKKEKVDLEEKNDSDEQDDEDNGKKKKNWRTNKLLRGKLVDTSSSEEERRWREIKKREEQMADNTSDSDELQKLALKNRKKIKRRLLADSDSDKDIACESSDSSSSSSVKALKRNASSSSVTSDDLDSSDSEKKKKKRKPPAKRRRIKAISDSASNSDEQNTSNKGDTPGKGRKNIRAVMKDDTVAEATRKAAKEEEERRKRIAEKQELYNKLYNELQEGVEKVEKLILDFDPETKEELVKVNEKLVQKMKPHQAKGVKFMWDACFESLKDCLKSKGSGCILAHCMGLGKTFQVVTLIHTLMNYKETKVHTVLVVCPLSTVLNWVNEFNIWLKEAGQEDEIEVFELSKYKKNYERAHQLKDWHSSGGVMVIGYDMFRILTGMTTKKGRKSAIEAFNTTLVDPGPDLVVCDEGHLLKNEDTALSKAMRKIKTLRRIVLTGTPLQNNLKEYHCMVQFVKPNLLGTRKEFLNRFVNPITNGQFEDSTTYDVKIMKRRAHVLHKMLEGCVQRFDYSVLMPFLPPKHEYVISIRLTEIQSKIYQHYLTHFAQRGGSNTGGRGVSLFADFQALQRIWTHPRVLQMNADKVAHKKAMEKEMESDSEGSLKDFIDDSDTTESTQSKSSSDESNSDSDVKSVDSGNSNSNKEKKGEVVKKWKSSTRGSKKDEEEKKEEEKEKEEKEEEPSQEWWETYLKGDEIDSIKESGKLVLLFSILQESEKIGDKVLVFSQSLYSLDLIEYFLNRIDAATQNNESDEKLCNHVGSWTHGLDYFRLDGQTSSDNRNIWCKTFNREDNYRARLFLISTRAGGLGINLFAANRVIIFDASWNPSHDVQSIFRVYRFGQKKPCFIYRFLALGTMEEKIYDRQIAKLSISCRVIDEQQIERHFNFADLNELYRFDPEQKTKRPTPILPKDRMLAEILKDHENIIETYHEHDSLLENKQEEELNEEERKAAWEDYENEKKGPILQQQNPSAGGPLDINFMQQYSQFNSQLNPQTVRGILKTKYPNLTEEQLQQQYRLVMQQLYDYAKTYNSQNLVQMPYQSQPLLQQGMSSAQPQNMDNMQMQFQQQMQQQQNLTPASQYQYQQLLRLQQLQKQQEMANTNYGIPNQMLINQSMQRNQMPKKMTTVSKHVKVTDFGNYVQNPYAPGAAPTPPPAHSSSAGQQSIGFSRGVNPKLVNPMTITQAKPRTTPIVMDTIDVE